MHDGRALRGERSADETHTRGGVSWQDGELEYRLPHRCHKLHKDPPAIGRPEQGREGELGNPAWWSIDVIRLVLG